MDPLPPYAALVLAGGAAARLGGQAKPQLQVGGRTLLDAVLAAVPDARQRIVVGPPQPVPARVRVVREEPPGGGPVAGLAAGLQVVDTEVVVVLAGDLPFLTADLVRQLRDLVTADGALVVDDTGRDQYLLGAWRTTALRTALTSGQGPASLRRVLAPLAVHRLHPVIAPGQPPPWLDCDTPADLARARAAAAPTAVPAPLLSAARPERMAPDAPSSPPPTEHGRDAESAADPRRLHRGGR